MARKKKKKNSIDQESIFDVISRNMREVPGFKALVKLGGYVLFLIVFIVIANIGAKQSKEKYDNLDYSNFYESLKSTTTKATDNNSKDTTTEETSKTYHDMIEDLYKTNRKINASISINDASYKLTMENTDNVLTGLYETKDTTKKFKIENNKVYEINLDSEKENASLLTGISLDYIIPGNLSNLLGNNKSIKTVDEEKYVYTYDLNTKKIIVTSTDTKITSIDITEGNKVYKITYE